MKLTQKLLGYLNRVFDKDPGKFVAMRVDYDGAMTWTVAEGILTFAVVGGSGAGVTYDLSQFTISGLVADLAGRRGYRVSYLDPDRSGLSGLVLLDGAGDQAQSNGDALFGYTSMLWAILESWASQLQGLRDAAAGAPAQMATTSAGGFWLDELGSYYNCPRLNGEQDPQYGPRIIAQAVRPLANNVALEVAIQSYTGQPVQVVDVVIYRGAFPIYDGTITHNSAHNYTQTGTANYGLFDVTVAYDILSGGDITTFLTTVTQIVETLRASGTHMRSLALSSAGTPISEAFTPPTESLSLLSLSAALADTLTAPTETMATIPVQLAGFSETLTAPSETATGGVLKTLTDSLGNPITDSSGNPIQANVGALFV